MLFLFPLLLGLRAAALPQRRVHRAGKRRQRAANAAFATANQADNENKNENENESESENGNENESEREYENVPVQPPFRAGLEATSPLFLCTKKQPHSWKPCDCVYSLVQQQKNCPLQHSSWAR